MGCKLQVEEICSRVCSGGTPNRKTAEYYEGGEIPWLNTGEISFNRVRSTNTHITSKGLMESSAKWIQKNAVIVAMYGVTAGKAALAKIPLTTNQACCNLEIDDSVADYRYVYYWFKNQYSKVHGLANGGAQQNLSVKIIKSLTIDLPPLSSQREIAEILSTLDDKIELNNRTNDYLLSCASSGYCGWQPFVSGPDSSGLHPRIPQSKGRLLLSCSQIPEAA